MERLNGLDGAFVSLESPTTHLHILGALVFDPANVPGGVDFSRIRGLVADRVHLVTEDGEVAAGEGQRHSEYPIHTEIMNARPDVGAVVHTHPPHAVALGATGQPLRPVSHAANYFAPDVPRFTLTADLIRTRALGKEVAAALGAAPAVLLVNHGIVTVGKSVQTATVAAVLLERACQQQMLTHAFGGWPTWSGSEESSAKQQKIYADDRMQAVWEYLARSLDH